jgi:hypothetical protein
MKIGIIGTRGIPNHYGGFEQFAERFSVRMVERGHEVSVYTSHRHPYKSATYEKVDLIRCYDPEYEMGTAGQFIYDFNCIRDSRRRNFDLILQLGYTSSTVWSWLYPSEAVLATNMDGLEWTRAKYSRPVRSFLKRAERWGVKHSHQLIADSKGIQDYLKEKYAADSVLVAYGAEVYTPDEKAADILEEYSLSEGNYDLLIARFEPENNIETILKTYSFFKDRKLLLIGDHERTAFGKRMFKEYWHKDNLVFCGSIFDKAKLDALRYYSGLYLHGHSSGGTNPSLLEAMGCHALICAHDNIFNRHVLGEEAFYFSNEKDLSALLAKGVCKHSYRDWLFTNLEKIKNEYNWDLITQKLESYFIQWTR